ncbi:MAG: sulfate adenylyltransferase subunit CysD [Candidatus Riflebacteria bacterium]|nr:sulfate adenylyltransferase subunit CysD [Candidatus Riflebacteria bacterium]
MTSYNLSYLKTLESESIHIMREVAAEFKNPVMLYSVGKDSSVMVRLAQKAFFPGKFPFPLMHIDTGYKFPEMYSFRDEFCRQIEANLIIERDEHSIAEGCNPLKVGVDKCCSFLKTGALLEAIKKHRFDAAFGGARREEEKSRAKERVFSLRDAYGQWDPKRQRPELWDLFNTRINEDETMRVFPLSNWTEQDIWEYIKLEKIPIVPIYFACEREVIVRNGILIPLSSCSSGENKASVADATEKREKLMCRFRSLGCIPCTGAIASSAATLDEIIKEVRAARKSERENRVIDLTSDSSMEQKKREGYF